MVIDKIMVAFGFAIWNESLMPMLTFLFHGIKTVEVQSEIIEKLNVQF